MNVIISLLAVIVLSIIAYVGVEGAGLRVLFGVIIPYAAVLTFFIGMVYRVVDWAKSPVPFRIPTTAGQEKSLPWIKYQPIENPSTGFGAFIRMAIEVLTFRSLFRNMKLDFREGPKIRYSSEKFLWLFAILFHYSFLVTLLRHVRFFTDPIPGWVQLLEQADSMFKIEVMTPFFEVGLPALLLSGLVLGGMATLLLVRRLWIPQVRYISLPADYFPLLLIIGIALTGILQRYVLRVDVVSIKELTMGLATLSPSIPDGVSGMFYVHLFLVSVLFAYFPFSKLVHMGGVFLSPTRNLANNSRAVRHINPWMTEPVKYHTYEAYEDDFRELMVEAGLPVDKPLEPQEESADDQGEKE